MEGPRDNIIYDANGVAAMPIGAHSATVYSKSFDLTLGENFAVVLKAAGTTINLQVQLEQSYQEPATEGAADAQWAVPNGASDIIDGLNSATIYLKSVSPVALRYARLKIITKTGNTSDVTLSARISKTEAYGV